MAVAETAIVPYPSYFAELLAVSDSIQEPTLASQLHRA